jgi:hypothetical protein
MDYGNPDEYVNQDIKQQMKKKPAPRSGKELQDGLHSYMKSLQRRKSKVARFFEHEKVKYAKAG